MMPKADNIKEIEVEKTKILEVTSPSAGISVPKAQKDLTATPKRKRMVNVLDVLETIKSSSTTPKKTAEAPKTQIEPKTPEDEAIKGQTVVEAGPSEPTKEKSLEIGEETKKRLQSKFCLRKLSLQLPKHLPERLIILYDMLRVKGYLKRKGEKLSIMPRN
jgi:hypothetical protein